MSAASPTKKAVSPWIKAAVLFHVVAIVAWSLPRPRAAIINDRSQAFGSDNLLLWGNDLRGLAPITVYCQTTGSWQYWDMFAPDPSNTDFWADAVVELRDGTKEIVSYPRIYALNLGDKYMKERFRKFFERAGDQNHAYLWPTFAIQMARKASHSADNPPVAVTLQRHSLRITPPHQAQPTEYTVERYFRYALRPGDLERGEIR